MSYLRAKCIHPTVTTFLLGPKGLNFLVQFYVPQHLTLEQSEFWPSHRTVFWDVTLRRRVNQDVSKKCLRLQRAMNAPWRMSMWLVDGQWVPIVQRRRVNIGLQIFSKLRRKAILERFSRELVTKCQFASKSGELRVFTCRPLAFLSPLTFLSLFYAWADWWLSCCAHAQLSRSGFILNLLK